MRTWRVVLLLNLALAVGVGWGYLWWGREARRLAGELALARLAAAPGGEREYRAVRGVVRAILPESGLLVVSHEEIPGLMPAMQMAFRVASPELLRAVEVGDAVRFTLRGTPPSLAVTAIERAGP